MGSTDPGAELDPELLEQLLHLKQNIQQEDLPGTAHEPLEECITKVVKQALFAQLRTEVAMQAIDGDLIGLLELMQRHGKKRNNQILRYLANQAKKGKLS